MPFTFADHALVDSVALSRFIWGVEDAATDTDVALSSQTIYSIELLVNAISTQIIRHVSSNIKEATYQEVWDGAASDELVPRERPISSVTAYKLSANGDFTASNIDYVTAAPGMVYTDGQSILLRGLRAPVGRGLVQLTYVAGYAAVPDDIQLAVLLQFQWALRQIGKGDAMVGIKAISKMQESQTKDDSLGTTGLRSEVIGYLAPYKRFEAPLSIMFTRVS